MGNGRSRSDEHTTSMEEYTVTAISGSEFTAKLKFTMTIDGNEVFSKEDNVRYVKQTADYRADIVDMILGNDANGGNYGNARRMTDDTVEPQ